jgi:biopolymer transport protein ExbD
MITQPFNFAAHLRRPPSAFDALAFVDACLIALMFTLLSSRFVLAPGVNLELPTTREAPLSAILTSRVLTVTENEGREMLIFEGRILNLETFANLLADRPTDRQAEVLLILADRDVSMQKLVRICELAEQAGFVSVQLAAEPEKAVRPEFR